MRTAARSSVDCEELLARSWSFYSIVQLWLAVAGHLCCSRPGHDGSRSSHCRASRQHPGFRHVLVLTQYYGPCMNPRNHRDMDAGDDARVHTRDNLVANQRHGMNANDWLHSSDRHDAVDMPHIVRPRHVPVSNLMYVTIPRSRDVMIASASYVAVSIDIADPRHGLVPIDRTHRCAGDRLLAIHAVPASLLCRQWGRNDHGGHKSGDTS
jgi:hypothetical protein